MESIKVYDTISRYIPRDLSVVCAEYLYDSNIIAGPCKSCNGEWDDTTCNVCVKTICMCRSKMCSKCRESMCKECSLVKGYHRYCKPCYHLEC